MKKYVKEILLASLVLAPISTFAQSLGRINDLLVEARTTFNLIFPILVGLALIVFFWGIIQFIRHSADPKGREEGRKAMIWGIIAFFVMLSLVGIIGIIADAFDIRQSGSITDLWGGNLI